MEQIEPISTGRRVWAITAIIMSVLVLLLVFAGTAGIWVVRSKAIQANNALMDGVYELAAAGRNGAQRLDEGIAEIQGFVAEVESAFDIVSQDTSDKGLFLTLLPEEKELEIVEAVDSISETISQLLSAVEAAQNLYRTVNEIPFIDLPELDENKVQALAGDIQEIQGRIDKLVADIQEFREGVASKVSEAATVAGEVNQRLEQASQDLSDLDSDLETLQTRSAEWKSAFAMITAVIALLLTFIFVWTIYGMVVVIRKHWEELNAGKK